VKLTELAQIAMLGTERQSLPAPGGDNPLSDLLAQLDLKARERSLLCAAAVSAIHERVGALPLSDSTPLPAASAEETSKITGARGSSLLRRLLDGEHPPLVPDCLTLMARAKQVSVPELLPALLALGAGKSELREAILPVLGQRGLWLATQNADWGWVSGATADEGVWQTGEKAARLLFLRQLRRSNPARAIELLGSTWKEETPDDRAAFVAELMAGLAATDEAFLETALDDKRKEVRRAAAGLLARLPDSAFVRRMTDRVRPLLKFAPAEAGAALKLKRAKKASLEVTLPADCDRAMQRDGIEPRAQEGFGEKAWWLIQMVEFVPLTVWTTEWKVAPVDLFTASQAGDWKKEFMEAWTRATSRQQNSDWAEVLFTPILEAERFDKLEGLLAAMSAPQREARITELLAQNDKKMRALHDKLLALCRHDWSPAFSRAVLALIRKETARESSDWMFRNQFKDLAPFLAPAVLAETANGWKTDSKAWEFWSKGVDEFLAVTQFRADLHAAFDSKQ
jgi:hypothetical protein